MAEGTDSSTNLTFLTHANQIFVMETGYIDVPNNNGVDNYTIVQRFNTTKVCPHVFIPYFTITTTQQREYAGGSHYIAAFGACINNVQNNGATYTVTFLQQRVSGVIGSSSKAAYQYDFPSYVVYGANSDWQYINPPYDPSRGLWSTSGTIRRIGYDGTSTSPTNEYYQGGFTWVLYCYPYNPPSYSNYCIQGVTPYTP